MASTIAFLTGPTIYAIQKMNVFLIFSDEWSSIMIFKNYRQNLSAKVSQKWLQNLYNPLDNNRLYSGGTTSGGTTSRATTIAGFAKGEC